MVHNSIELVRKQKPQSELEKDETKHRGAYEHKHKHTLTYNLYAIMQTNWNTNIATRQ